MIGIARSKPGASHKKPHNISEKVTTRGFRWTRDPTHVNIKPTLYWTDALLRFGLQFDIESFERYARSERSPEKSPPAVNPFWKHYPGWSVWTLIKPN